jgi:hypothetical protein
VDARARAREAELAAAADRVAAAVRQGRAVRRVAGRALTSGRRAAVLAQRGCLGEALHDSFAAAEAAVAAVPRGEGGLADAGLIRFDPAGAHEVQARGAGLGCVRAAPPPPPPQAAPAPPPARPPPQEAQLLAGGGGELWSTGTWPAGGLGAACEAILLAPQPAPPPPAGWAPQPQPQRPVAFAPAAAPRYVGPPAGYGPPPGQGIALVQRPPPPQAPPPLLQQDASGQTWWVVGPPPQAGIQMQPQQLGPPQHGPGRW